MTRSQIQQTLTERLIVCELCIISCRNLCLDVIIWLVNFSFALERHIILQQFGCHLCKNVAILKVTHTILIWLLERRFTLLELPLWWIFRLGLLKLRQQGVTCISRVDTHTLICGWLKGVFGGQERRWCLWRLPYPRFVPFAYVEVIGQNRIGCFGVDCREARSGCKAKLALGPWYRDFPRVIQVHHLVDRVWSDDRITVSRVRKLEAIFRHTGVVYGLLWIVTFSHV